MDAINQAKKIARDQEVRDAIKTYAATAKPAEEDRLLEAALSGDVTASMFLLKVRGLW